MSRKLLIVLGLGCLSTLQSGALQTAQSSEPSQKIVLTGSIAQDVYQEPGVVGLDLEIRPGNYPIVRRVFQDSPAQRAGIRPGDVILTIDGASTQGRSLRQIDAAISDVPGTPVIFTLNHQNRLRTVQLKVISLGEVSNALRMQYTPLVSDWPNQR